MGFGHEKLDVYRAAIEYVGWGYTYILAPEHGSITDYRLGVKTNPFFSHKVYN